MKKLVFVVATGIAMLSSSITAAQQASVTIPDTLIPFSTNSIELRLGIDDGFLNLSVIQAPKKDRLPKTGGKWMDGPDPKTAKPINRADVRPDPTATPHEPEADGGIQIQ